MEPGRRYADDGERILVELNRAAQHAAVILKTGVPIRVTEHDIRSAVGTVLIGIVKKTANIRPNALCVEVVPAHFIEPDAGWIFPRVHPRLRDVKSCQTIKAAVAIAQIEIVGI